MKQKIVLATGNEGKVREMADGLADFGCEVSAQTDLGIDSPEETGLTFVENAILKARYAAEKSGLPAIADDSGLVVDAGEPVGVTGRLPSAAVHRSSSRIRAGSCSRRRRRYAFCLHADEQNRGERPRVGISSRASHTSHTNLIICILPQALRYT